MVKRSLWRIRTKLAVAATALCGGASAAVISTSDDPATAIKLCTAVPLRLVRDSITAASIAFGILSLEFKLLRNWNIIIDFLRIQIAVLDVYKEFNNLINLICSLLLDCLTFSIILFK